MESVLSRSPTKLVVAEGSGNAGIGQVLSTKQGEPKNVLVTGVGGPAGYQAKNILEKMTDSQQRPLYRIVKTDIDSYAAGFYNTEREKSSYIVPKASSKDFIPRILDISKREKVQIILPTVEEELIHFARNITEFDKRGITVAVSNVDSLLRTNNKRETYAFFKGAEYCPEVYDGSNVKFPCVIKPEDGRGGRGVWKCVSDMEELGVLLKRNRREFGASIIMEQLSGPEYSVYGISDFEGKPMVTIPNMRMKANGASIQAQVIDHKKAKSVASEIATKLQLQGPWNIQLMGEGDRLKLVEVNPRFAGTMALINHVGVNMPELTIKMFTGQDITKKELKWKAGTIMIRAPQEHYLEQYELLR